MLFPSGSHKHSHAHMLQWSVTVIIGYASNVEDGGELLVLSSGSNTCMLVIENATTC